MSAVTSVLLLMLAPFAYPPIARVLPTPEDGSPQYTVVLQSVVTRCIALVIGCAVSLLLRFLGKLGLRAAMVAPPTIAHPDFDAIRGESAPALSSPGLHLTPDMRHRFENAPAFDPFATQQRSPSPRRNHGYQSSAVAPTNTLTLPHHVQFGHLGTVPSHARSLPAQEKAEAEEM